MAVNWEISTICPPPKGCQLFKDGPPQATNFRKVNPPATAGHPSQIINDQPLGMSLFRKVPMSLSEYQHDITMSMLTKFGRKLYQTSILYVRDCRARVLEWGGLSRPTLSILKLGGSGGMLPQENFKIWVPECLKIQCSPCTCSHVTATRIKGLPTGMFLRAQREFRCRNRWKYRIRCRFISYKFRCRKFPAACCHLSPFRSPHVAVSRQCSLLEFTPYRALWTGSQIKTNILEQGIIFSWLLSQTGSGFHSVSGTPPLNNSPGVAILTSHAARFSTFKTGDGVPACGPCFGVILDWNGRGPVRFVPCCTVRGRWGTFPNADDSLTQYKI